jgi:hypothetical protein
MFNYKSQRKMLVAQDKITKELWEHINSMYFYQRSDFTSKLETSNHGHIDQTQ